MQRKKQNETSEISSPKPVILKDLQLCRYRFFSRKNLEDDKEELKAEFSKVLNWSVIQIGGLQNTLQQKIEIKSSSIAGHSDPIISHSENYKHFNGFYRTLHSFITLDVYSIHGWVGVEQAFTTPQELEQTAKNLENEIFKTVETNDKKNDETNRLFAQKTPTELEPECLCYFGEFETENLDPKPIFDTLLATTNYSSVEFDFAHFAIVLQENAATAVIISKNFAHEKAKSNAAYLLDKLLREYFLAFAKVESQSTLIRNLQTTITRRNLHKYLNKYQKNPPFSLGSIETVNRDLNQLRAELGYEIKEIEAALHTIDINIHNAREVLKNKLLVDKYQELSEILISPMEATASQKKADLTYHKIYEEKGKIIAEEIANLSNLQAGKYGRKVAWLFGLLALVGVLQLFPEFQNWKNWWLKTIILTVVVLLPMIILFGNETWLWLKSLSGKNKENKIRFTPEEKAQVSPAKGRLLPPISAEFELPKTNEKEKVETK